MADSKISDLTALSSPANDDVFAIVDTDAGQTKKITFANINSAVSSAVSADDIGTGDAAVSIATSSGNITIDAQAGDTDIIFKGTDGSSDITALTLDMSEAGAASFNSTVTATGFVIGSASIDETELEILDGATLSTTELNYVDGVTSAIQTQLDAKQATLTFGISNTNVPKFTTGVVDDDFLRIAGTTVEGRSASEVLSDIGGQASLTFGISDTNAVKVDSSSVADDEYARFTSSGLESRSTAEVLSDIGGQASLTFGISNTNAVKVDSSSVADDEYARFTANGLESRSTSEVLSDIGGQATLTFGISNTNAVKVDSSSVADDEYARFTANGLESRSTSEVLSDIGGQATLTFGISNTNAVKVDSASVADDEYARFTANGLESRSTSEVLSDIGGITASSSDTLTNKSIDSDNNTITNIVNADIKSSAAIAFSKMADLTASRALVSDGSGDVSAATTTSTEIGYVNGVTSAIQTQLDAKATAGLAVAMAIAL